MKAQARQIYTIFLKVGARGREGGPNTGEGNRQTNSPVVSIN